MDEERLEPTWVVPPVPVLVVDPNVYVSAAIAGRGPTVMLVQAAAAGTVELVASPLLLRELRTTLDRPKFRRYLTARKRRSSPTPSNCWPRFRRTRRAKAWRRSAGTLATTI